MALLTDVSETALITLKARVLEAQRPQPVLQDEVGPLLLTGLQERLPEVVRQRLLQRPLPISLTRHIALRARYYDRATASFIRNNPGGVVVSLGSGFDTRYWRLSDSPWNYIEVDLPAVMAAKRAVLGERISYPLIGGSVLEESWLDEISTRQTENILFLAEGLLMYLPPEQVKRLFQTMAERFSNTTFMFEVVHRKYTQGVWKKVVERKMRRNLGSEAGTSFQYGVTQAGEVERYHPAIRLETEWSYFEEPEIKPAFLRLFRGLPLMTRTQWTITVRLTNGE
jgi:methyltransferase (TIGR00027 family)